MPGPNERQFSQTEPKLPQVTSAVPDWQTPLASQQPAGHVVASHPWGGGTVAVHALPVAGFDTQVMPVAEQSVHWPPFWPHAAVALPARHCVPRQQPAQVAGPHGELAHCCATHARPLAAHDWHCCPPAPHAVGAPPRWQRPFVSQQPIGQEAGEHVAAASETGGRASTTLAASRTVAASTRVAASTWAAASMAAASTAPTPVSALALPSACAPGLASTPALASRPLTRPAPAPPSSGTPPTPESD